MLLPVRFWQRLPPRAVGVQRRHGARPRNTDSLEDVLLPDLKANNRKECGSSLYAFHAIFTAIAPFLPEGPE